jgi:GTP-binding protein
VRIRSARFLASQSDPRKCPPPQLPEFAFIGRSNVGKSSLVNHLLHFKKLAHTSSTPGKTQTINHFLVNEAFYLVDLPGYGFAKTSRSRREQWQRTTWQYLRHRENLVSLFVLVDVRIAPQRADLDFIDRLGEAGIPFALVFTKADKVKPAELRRNIDRFLEALSETWEQMPEHFITSAVTGTGRLKLLGYLGLCIETGWKGR